MHAEVIAVGSELTSGARLDTNSPWLSRELAAVGIPVRYHATAGDELDAVVDVLRTAVERSDIVLITGGLGPTLDDLTRQALASLTGRELVLHQPSWEHIKSLFAKRHREMPERNVVQAMFPQGSEPLVNPHGTAPGIWMQVPRADGTTPCRIAALPGVPSEMKPMFRNQVLPRLPVGDRIIRTAQVNCFGAGESDVEARLGELTARGRNPEVGITAHEATISLRITAQGNTVEDCDRLIAEIRSEIRHTLGNLVFGEDDEELEHVVVRLLVEQGLTLSTAESGTGGLLAHRLTEVAGHEGCYLGGVVVPTDAAKRDVIGVDARVLQTAGPVSAETAAAMAQGCRRRLGTDFALSVTELSRSHGPPCEQPCVPTQSVGTRRSESDTPSAYVALAGPDVLELREQRLAGDPAIIKSRTAKAALNLLRLHLSR